MAKKERKKTKPETKPKVEAQNSVKHSSPAFDNDFGGLPAKDLKKNLGCG